MKPFQKPFGKGGSGMLIHFFLGGMTGTDGIVVLEGIGALEGRRDGEGVGIVGCEGDAIVTASTHFE